VSILYAMLKIVTAAPSLFEPDLPPGFVYRDDFISAGEESALSAEISQVEFSNFEMRGAIARRRVAFFGKSYTTGERTAPIPEFLLPLRARIADWAQIPAEAFAMALINEYRAGAPIGWHRDAPQYEIIAGVSLLAECRMKLRPYVSPRDLAAPEKKLPRKTTHEITLKPRSAYIISGPARQRFEHSIPPVVEMRYSITFRTLRS
jgi:alkylated DNA repair dioxygenase AlkB